MAERIARDWLDRHDVRAQVASCGVMEGGVVATRGAVRALSRRGLDLTDHRSQQVDAETLAAADLVLTMERRHLRSIGDLSLPAIGRAFTLRELAEIAPTVGPRFPDVTVAEWVTRADAMRAPGSVLTMSTEDDVPDPMGGSRRDYRRAAEEIESLLERILSALFPAPPEHQ
jgi:protein-tyrosine phosphatase